MGGSPGRWRSSPAARRSSPRFGLPGIGAGGGFLAAVAIAAVAIAVAVGVAQVAGGQACAAVVSGGAAVVSGGAAGGTGSQIATHYVLQGLPNCSYPSPPSDGLYVALPPAGYASAASAPGASAPGAAATVAASATGSASPGEPAAPDKRSLPAHSAATTPSPTASARSSC